MHVLYEIWLVFANIFALLGIFALEYGVLEGIFMLKDKLVSK